MVAGLGSRKGAPLASASGPGGIEGLVGPLAGLREHVRPWTERLERAEPWLVAPCAIALLLYPNPLVLPAAVLGSLPSAARWLSHGRLWPKTAFDLPLALFLAGALLGGAAGLSSEGTALRLFGILAGLQLHAALLVHARSARQFRLVTIGGLIVAAIVCLVLVGIVAPFLRLDRVPPLGGLAHLLDPLDMTEAPSGADALLQRYRLRASGVGAMADVGLVLLFATGIGLTSWKRRLLLLPVGAFFAAVLLVSDNRGSMLAGAMTLGILAAYCRPWLLPLAPLGGLGVLGLLHFGLIPKGLDLRTITQRFWFWDNSLYLARELPLTGAGLGTQSVQLTFQTYFQSYFQSNPGFSHAHNIYLQGLLEQGIFGLIGLAGLTLATMVVGWRARNVSDRWIRAGGLAGLGMALALFTTGLSEITALSTIGSALLLAGFGLLDAASMHGAPAPVADHARTGRLARRIESPRLPLPSAPNLPRRTKLIGGVVGLAAVATILVVSGVGARAVAAVLLNFGTVELNRATISEETTKTDRQRYLDNAIRLLRAAAALDENNATIQRNRALTLAGQGDNRRGHAAADRASSLTDPNDLHGLFQVGRAYVELNVWGDAIAAWQAAGAAPQLLQLGGQLIRMRNWNQAIAAYYAAAILVPHSRSAYEGIGRAARRRGDTTEEIIAELEPLIALSGEYALYGHLQVARIYREDGRLNEALAHVDIAQGLRHDEFVDGERGAILVELGRFAEAEPVLLAATMENPNEIDFIRRLATVQVRLGKYDEAIATTTAALNRTEDSFKKSERGPLLALLGDSLLARNRHAEALAAYEEGLSTGPDDPRVRAQLEEGAERARVALGK
jgi:tetratricopeptide (TPR) repeat protein/O-antigen ligase